MEKSPYVITISRQLGSGGAYIGQKLAKRLGIMYLNREIIHNAAKKLNIPEESIESRDEKITSFWQSFVANAAYTTPDVYLPPPIYIPTDKELFQVESEIIQNVAKNNSCIIIGRCGSFILKEHERHLSIYLHADTAFRENRVKDLYENSNEKTIKMIENSDRERAHYIHTMTGQEWTDVRNYHLSIDAGAIGLEETENIIYECVKNKFE